MSIEIRLILKIVKSKVDLKKISTPSSFFLRNLLINKNSILIFTE